MHRLTALALTISFLAFMAPPATAGPFFFSTGGPTNFMATVSRPDVPAGSEIESADDFITTAPKTLITKASFTGLLMAPPGTPTPNVGDIGQVVVEIYRVFPNDSNISRPLTVPERTESPSDVVFQDSRSGGLNFMVSDLGSFSALNSVLPGNIRLNTGGNGTVIGEEVQFDVEFNTPFKLPAGHYFFIPQVEVTGGNFLWLSASRPIAGSGTTPFAPDYQSWIRDASLKPDWLRVGTDIVGGSQAPTFNASFSLTGTEVPLPGTLPLLAAGLLGLLGFKRSRKS